MTKVQEKQSYDAHDKVSDRVRRAHENVICQRYCVFEEHHHQKEHACQEKGQRIDEHDDFLPLHDLFDLFLVNFRCIVFNNNFARPSICALLISFPVACWSRWVTRVEISAC